MLCAQVADNFLEAAFASLSVLEPKLSFNVPLAHPRLRNRGRFPLFVRSGGQEIFQ